MVFRSKKLIICFVFCLFLLASCGRNNELGFNKRTVSPVPPTPETGMATIVGQIISMDTDKPLGNTVVRLAEVYYEGDEGAYVLDTAFSPGDITNAEGYFVFPSTKAGDYVIVVGDIEKYGEYEIIAESSGKAKVWKAKANEITDVGKLIVNLPK
jgi:uncharacterized membrane protein